MPDRVSDSIDLRDLLTTLRQARLFILFCAILCGGAALALALNSEKQYSAKASLLFRDPAFDQKLFGSTFIPGSKDPDREAATNVTLVETETKEIAPKVAETVGGGLTGDEVEDSIEAASLGRADVVSITVTLDNPVLAARVANGFVEQYISARRAADRAVIVAAERLVEKQLDALEQSDASGASSQARSLRDRAEQLSVLGSLQTGNAELVGRATVPEGPSAPRPKRNAVLGLLVGGLLGVALALLRRRIDRRLTTVESLEQAFGVPALARVPVAKEIRSADGTQPRVNEAFRTLWTNLRYFNVSRKIDSVLVTSTASGDGKTTVAFNLAAAAARSGTSVLLLEADLRRPSLFRMTEQSNPLGGLTDVLSRDLPLSSVVTHVPAYAGGALADERTFDMLLAGSIPPNPTEMLDSSRMRDLLREACEQYDLVVVDTPPIAVVPDAVPLLKQVSAVMVVARVGRTSRDDTAALTSQLRSLDVPIVGIVANYDTQLGADYDYYTAAPADRPDAAVSAGASPK